MTTSQGGQQLGGDAEVKTETSPLTTQEALEELERNRAGMTEAEYRLRHETLLTLSDAQGADLSLELRQQRADSLPKDDETLRTKAAEQATESVVEASEILDNIDWNSRLENLPEQTQALLTDLTIRLITKARAKGIDADKLAKLPELSSQLALRAEMGSNEIKAWEIFRQHSDSILARDLDKLAEDTVKTAPIASLVANPDTEKDDEPWIKKAAGTVWEFTKEHPWKTAGLVTVGALGAYGLYKLVPRFLKGFFEDDKDKLGWKFDMATNGTGIFTIGGVLIGAGVLLGPEKWRAWTRERLGINLSLETLGKCITEMSLKPLFNEIVETNKNDRIVAKHLDVSAEKIAMLREVKIEDFNSVTNSWVTFLQGKGMDFARNVGINLNVPFLNDMDERERAVDATEKLIELFERPDVKAFLGQRKPKTVGEALDALVEAKFFDSKKEKDRDGTEVDGAAVAEGVAVATGVAGAGTEAADTVGAVPETPPSYDATSGESLHEQMGELDLFGEGEGQIGISEDSWKWLEARLGASSKTHEVINRFDSATDWLKPQNFIDFAEALYKDGKGLVVNRKGLFIVDGGELIFLSNWGGLINTAIMSLEAMALEEVDYKDAITTYVDEELGFMVLFGAPTVLSGLWMMARGNWKGGAGEVLRGAAKGTAGPILFAWWQGEKAADIKRWVEEGVRFKWRFNLDEAAKADLQVKQLKYYMDMFEIFDKRYQSTVVEKGIIPTSKEVGIGKHLARKTVGLLRRERLIAQRMYYARRIIQTSNGMVQSGTFDNHFGIKNETGRIDPDVIDFDELYKAIDKNRGAVRAVELKQMKPEIDAKSKDYYERWRKGATEGIAIKDGEFTYKQARRMLAEQGINPASPEADVYMEKWCEAVAKEEVINGKFKQGTQVEGLSIKPRVELLKSTPNGNVYRYMGMEITIPKEVSANLPSIETSPFEHFEQARVECSTRWQVHGRQAVIDSMSVLEYSEERATFRIGNEDIVIERANTPEAMERVARSRFLDAHKDAKFVEVVEKPATATQAVFEINGEKITVDRPPAADLEQAARTQYVEELRRGSRSSKRKTRSVKPEKLKVSEVTSTPTETTYRVTMPDGSGVRDITIPKEGTGALRQEAIRQYDAKSGRTTPSTELCVESVDFENGKVRINGEEIPVEKFNPAEFREGAARRYLEIYEKEGKTPPPGLRDAITRSASWLPELEAVLGVAGTAWVFYEALWAGKSNKEAAVSILSGVASAFGAVKIYEMTAGKHIKNPYLHLFGTVVAGIVGVMGLQDDFEWILEKTFDAIPGLNVEGAHIITRHMMVRSGINWTVRPILREIPRLATKPVLREIPKLATKLGLKAFGKRLSETVIAKLAKRLLVFVGKKAGAALVKCGLKGVGGGLLFLDDASLVGILDDGLAIALWGWTIYDVGCIISLVRKAFIYKSEMETRNKAEIESVEILDPQDKERIAEKLRTEYQLTNEEIFDEHGNISSALYGHEELGEIILADIMQNGHFLIKRIGIEGGEEYFMQNGEAAKVIIYGAGNEEIVNLTLEEIEKAEETADEIEEASPEDIEEAKNASPETPAEGADKPE